MGQQGRTQKPSGWVKTSVPKAGAENPMCGKDVEQSLSHREGRMGTPGLEEGEEGTLEMDFHFSKMKYPRGGECGVVCVYSCMSVYVYMSIWV